MQLFNVIDNMNTVFYLIELGLNNSFFLLGFLGPFICCKRNILIDPPGPHSSIWGVNGGPDSKYGGLTSSQSQNAINDYKNNPDKWTPANPPNDPNRPVGPWTEWKREAEFCGGRFNGWL